jgi:hypothetical protein
VMRLGQAAARDACSPRAICGPCVLPSVSGFGTYCNDPHNTEKVSDAHV